MRITIHGEEFLFDELSQNCSGNEKLFISNLFQTVSLPLPEKMPKIYTSKNLARQLTLFLQSKGLVTLNSQNFVILNSEVPTVIKLTGNTNLQVLMLTPDNDIGQSLFAFRTDQRVTHFYAGICTQINSFILNHTFHDWVSPGVDSLYLFLKRSVEHCHPREHHIALCKIMELFSIKDKKCKMQIIIPIFGYEDLIIHLVKTKPKIVLLTGFLEKLFSNLSKNFQTDASKAEIFLTAKNLSMDKIKYLYKKDKRFTVKVSDTSPIDYPEIGYFEVFWSPLPNNFDTWLLPTLLHPKRIVPIVNKHISTVDFGVPDYLANLCDSESDDLNDDARANQITENDSTPALESPEVTDLLPELNQTPSSSGRINRNNEKKTIEYNAKNLGAGDNVSRSSSSKRSFRSYQKFSKGDAEDNSSEKAQVYRMKKPKIGYLNSSSEEVLSN